MPMTGYFGKKIRIGDELPDFEAPSTKGFIRFRHWLRGGWGILFVHASDFSPVPTSELGVMASRCGAWKRKGLKVASLSPSKVSEHLDWQRDVVAQLGQGAHMDFPMLSDPHLEICESLGLVDAFADDVKNEENIASTCRGLMVIGPGMKVKLMMNYPETVGFNFHELDRACDALLLCDRLGVATPACWPDNHANLEVGGESMEGAVFIDPRAVKSQEEDNMSLEDRFPDAVNCSVPSGRRYLTLTHPRPERRTAGCFEAFCFLFRTMARGGLSEAAVESALLAARNTGTGGPCASAAERPRYVAPSLATMVPFPSSSSAGSSPTLIGSPGGRRVGSQDGVLRIGDIMPDFSADTTHGRMAKFHDWIAGKWSVLCVHGAAFTPVDTTALGALSLMHERLAGRGVRVAALSCDSIQEQLRWEKDIMYHFDMRARIPFPLISDPKQELSAILGAVDAGAALRRAPRQSSVVYLIGPDRRLRLRMEFPEQVGFDVREIVRVCDAVRIAERDGVELPADWPYNHEHINDKKGESMTGSVLLPLSMSSEAEAEKFPETVHFSVPSKKDYFRLAKPNGKGMMPMCANCIASSVAI